MDLKAISSVDMNYIRLAQDRNRLWDFFLTRKGSFSFHKVLGVPSVAEERSA